MEIALILYKYQSTFKFRLESAMKGKHSLEKTDVKFVHRDRIWIMHLKTTLLANIAMIVAYALEE